MSVVAKFHVQRVECSSYQRQIDAKGKWDKDNIERVEMRTVVLSPVYGNGDPNHENTKFWDATPSGEIKLGTINPEAWKYFDLEGEYLVTFQKV